MKNKNLIFAFVALLFSSGMMAQELFPPIEIIQGTFIGTTMPLRDFPTTQNFNTDPASMTIFPNRSRYNAKVNDNALPLNDMNFNIQDETGGIATYALEQNFVGFNNTGFTPPDPTGAVGPNHYVHAVNSSIKIFDKSGTVLAGPTSLGAFLGIGSNTGDPIILYDHLVDRYFVSEFGSLSNSLAIGISVTNDPTGAYNVYQFSLDAFPDYPHYSVWPDAYYVTANKGGTNKVYAIEKDVMIAGGTNPQIIGFPLPGSVQNTNTVYSPEPANLLGTDAPTDVPGYIVYLQDDGWSGVTFDHLKVWEIDVDFAVPGNSTISAPLEIPTDPFNSVFAPFGTGDVNQPGTGNKIDMIGGVISYAANYRSFGDHNSWVITFNDDIDGNDTSGVRWIELRNDAGNPWTVYQEGTYAPADGHSRFMGSAAMDAAGNIGLGFNIASASIPVGIRYTGRFDGDPLGQMTVAETTIIDGAGVQTNTNRFGDYSHLTMDPNNFTFWHTAEYFSSNNQWRTRVASFSLSSGFVKDVGVSSIENPNNGVLTTTESVEVTIRNFGTAAQSNIPLELRVDGNVVASETYGGTINANDVVNYTFTQTVDLSNVGQTYSIEAKTLLVGDEFTPNDTFTKEVSHLLSNDIGVTDITSPNPVTSIGNQTVTITIKNFGATTQSNFDVQYTLDGGTPVIETVAGSLATEEEVSYSFTQQADLTVPATYIIVSKTNLVGDQDTSNDESTLSVTSSCLPTATAGCNLDGIKMFELNTISADDGANGCNTEPANGPNGYADRTNLSTDLANLAGSNVYTLKAQQNWTGGAGVEALSVWIDFNDNGIFEASEQLISGEFFQSDNVLENFILTIPVGAALGTHILRAKAIDTSATGDINDPCSDYDYGETQDYTVVIVDQLGVNDFAINESELIITSSDNKNFEVSLTSDFEGNVYVGIYNLLGQQLGYKKAQNLGGVYKMSINLSNVESGMYIVRVGGQTSNTYKTGRVIVK